MRIGPNTHAVVDYVLTDESGEVLDDSAAEGSEPLRYVHGYGMLVPGLEKQLQGLEQGTETNIVVSPEEAYGLHDDELVFVVARELAATAEEGDEVVLEDEEGEETVAHVTEVRPDELVLDSNHPLAGLTLRYHVNVREVRDATPEEVEKAARSFDDLREQADPQAEAVDPAFVPLFALRRPKDDLPS
jgi:FKBP-type peptidyl-prolyl cis-trans isomerase SlyD